MLDNKLKQYRISRHEYELIKKKLGREPQGVEWALFSALWSEHCSYKSSKIHLRNLFRQSQRVLDSVGENAGVIDLGQGEKIAFKMESHNHPSFIEPYQGAATGVGGILRDVFTMGARPIVLGNYLCFGEKSANRMATLVDGVVRGISGYGNCVGVPTVTGQTEFHSSYNKNILVNAFALGYFGKNDPICRSQASGVGNWVVYVGAKTGRDGVHGASMASESFDQNSEKKRPTVQIGDPFFEKLLIESCLEVMKQNLVVAIQDMGAAGLTSSSFEMAAKGGVGFDLDLGLVPLRDHTLTPEDILLSESQERMLLVCEPNQFNKIKSHFDKWGLDAAKIGEVVARPTLRLYWNNQLLTDMDPAPLVDEAPEYNRDFSQWEPRNRVSCAADMNVEVASLKDLTLQLVGSLQGTSREWVYQQYDQRVGARTCRDASHSVSVVVLPESQRALATVLGCRPSVMRWDAEIGGIDSVAYPSLELAIKGFEALGVTDCLNFGNPEKKEIMTEFVASLRGMSSMAQAIDAPIISGNVSFYNETEGQNITSTPSTGIVGIKESVDNIPDDTWNSTGQSVYLVQLPMADFNGMYAELNQSSYLGHGKIDIVKTAQFIKDARRFVLSEKPQSTRIVGKGGLSYALARLSMSGFGIHLSKTVWNHFFDRREFAYEHFYSFITTANSIDSVKKYFRSDVTVLELGKTQHGEIDFANGEQVKLVDIINHYKSGWRMHFETLA